jgi:hypothetical protein
MPENPTNDMTQELSAKSPKARLVARIARLVRQAGLDYAGWVQSIHCRRDGWTFLAPVNNHPSPVNQDNGSR